MKNIICSLVLLMVAISIQAQDIIVKLNNDELKVKIIEVNENDIRYKKFDNLEGPTYLLFKKDIATYQYQNGDIIILQDIKTSQSNADVKQDVYANFSSQEMYMKGKNDAEKYYKGYKPAATGTFLATVFPYTPLYGGLGTALGTSLTPPKVENLNYPDQTLWSNADYARGYMDTAKKIKTNKVWSNFAYGAATLVGVVFVAIILSTSSYLY